MRILFAIIVPLLLVPSVAYPQGYYEREAQLERLTWLPFLPEEVVRETFKEVGQEETPTADDYRIEINVAARRLFLFERDRMVRTYPVAVGSSRYRTPIGPRFLKEITWNPWWYPPPYSDWAKGATPTPPGPNNPLGRVKMSLGGDILLHGTNKEYTVGTPASHGCMRMKNNDAIDLAWFFQTHFTEFAGYSEEDLQAIRERYRRHRGTSFPVKLVRQIPVDIVYERVSVWARTMEVHPDIYGRTADLESQILEKLLAIGIPPWEVDQTKVSELKKNRETLEVAIQDLLASSGI